MVRGLDDRFLSETTYELAARAHGYESDARVWEAMGQEPGLAVVDGFVAHRRDNFGFGVVPELQLEGFYVEDQVFDPVRVEVRDPGVVALGVISARAVLERRQQIGVPRSIGFQPSMVRLSFLAEASFVSLTAIVMGTGLGLLTAFNVVADVGGQQDVTFAVPWLNLVVIFTVVYAAALASTFLPAARGSRVYPAEALWYE